MIESCYWKELLLDVAKSLKPTAKPKRLTERRFSVFERDITVSFLIVRRMFELHKISDSLRNSEVEIYSMIAKKKINRLNKWDIFESYDVENENSTKRTVWFICNQFIHSEVIQLTSGEDRNWDSIYIASDQVLGKEIYRIPVEVIIDILGRVGRNYPSSSKYCWDATKGDYTIRNE